jgi:3-methyladenine DNA glycosylase AlkD
MSTDEIINAVFEHSDQSRAEFQSGYFRIAQYGEKEDSFIGVKVPVLRTISKNAFHSISVTDLQMLISHKIHEIRLCAVFIMVLKFEKARSEEERKAITDFYMANLRYINNWDLVDSSAPKILGAFLAEKPKEIIYELSRSEDLWKQRIAIISTQYFIRKGILEHTFQIAEILLNNKHDLIHKAVGWMLREAGEKDLKQELTFLDKHYRKMPRTMLRYAIEKFDQDLRLKYLKG